MACYTINILDDYDAKCNVVTNVKPKPPAAPCFSNWSFEDHILDTSTASRGDILHIDNNTTHGQYMGCLYPFHPGVTARRGTGLHKAQAEWYTEHMLLCGLMTMDGSPCLEFEAAVVLVDDMGRINDVRLVPRGCPVDGLESISLHVITHASEEDRGPTSPRKKRVMEAFTKATSPKK